MSGKFCAFSRAGVRKNLKKAATSKKVIFYAKAVRGKPVRLRIVANRTRSTCGSEKKLRCVAPN